MAVEPGLEPGLVAEQPSSYPWALRCFLRAFETTAIPLCDSTNIF